MMKLLCLTCRSAFRLVAKRGKKEDVVDEKRVLVRCPMCVDIAVFSAFEAPKTEREKDELRFYVLDYGLQAKMEKNCARGRRNSKEFLVCSGCDVEGVIDKAFCAIAKERYALTEKRYNDGFDPPDPGPVEESNPHVQTELDNFVDLDDDFTP